MSAATKKILQVIPAAPGWTLVHVNLETGELYRVPLLLWALVDENGRQSVEPLHMTDGRWLDLNEHPGYVEIANPGPASILLDFFGEAIVRLQRANSQAREVWFDDGGIRRWRPITLEQPAQNPIASPPTPVSSDRPGSYPTAAQAENGPANRYATSPE